MIHALTTDHNERCALVVPSAARPARSAGDLPFGRCADTPAALTSPDVECQHPKAQSTREPPTHSDLRLPPCRESIARYRTPTQALSERSPSMPRGGRSALPRLLAFRTLQARNEEGRHQLGARLPGRWSTRRRVASRGLAQLHQHRLRRGADALPLTGGSILRLATGSVRKTAEVPPSRCSPWIVLVPESPSPNPGHSINTFAGFRSRGRSRVDPFHGPQPPSQAPPLGAPLPWPDRPTSHPPL